MQCASPGLLRRNRKPYLITKRIRISHHFKPVKVREQTFNRQTDATRSTRYCTTTITRACHYRIHSWCIQCSKADIASITLHSRTHVKAITHQLISNAAPGISHGDHNTVGKARHTSPNQSPDYCGSENGY